MPLHYSGDTPLNRSDRLLSNSTAVRIAIDRITRIVATARIVGLICSRMPENICRGMVLCLTSASWRTTTTSSKDVIKANKPPEITPGKIKGI